MDKNVYTSFLWYHFGGPAENDWNVTSEINTFCAKDVEIYVKKFYFYFHI